MKINLITLFIAGLLAFGAETKPVKADPNDVLKLENITLRENLLQIQYRDLQSAKDALFKDVCEKAKIAPESCGGINIQTGEIVIKERPKEDKPVAKPSTK